MMKEILITTTEHIPGHNYEIIGEVFGVTTQSRNAISDIGAGLKSIVGGEIKGYSKMIENSREQAIQRLREEADEKGADAIVMMRFDSGSIGTDMQSVVAYGTAVKFVD
ncbi:heavy metal-binding domain-containing protein [Lactobacillus kalixensis]|nr:heavy metal-binding domain-containing protein [Lactobacillus kalixensis]